MLDGLKGLVFIVLLTLPALPGAGQGMNTVTDIPAVDFCDLESEPTRFDQRVVRVRAIYSVGGDEATLYSPRCTHRNRIHITWASFDPSYKTCSRGEAVKSLESLRSKGLAREKSTGGKPLRQINMQRAEILAVGKFEASPPAGVEELTYQTFDFGEIKYNFIVRCVEKVKSVPGNVPW